MLPPGSITQWLENISHIETDCTEEISHIETDCTEEISHIQTDCTDKSHRMHMVTLVMVKLCNRKHCNSKVTVILLVILAHLYFS